MHEALAAMSVVQLNGAEDREHRRFSDINRRSLKQGVKGARLEARMNRSVELALAGGTVVILWVGTLRAMHGAITPAELIVFVSYLRAAYRPLRRRSKSVQRPAKALAATERIVDILDTEPGLADAPDAVEAPHVRGAVSLEQVDFGYLPGRPVLHNVSFEVSPGRRIAIVGPTGSGKSTLMSLIPRMFDTAGGRVLLDGRDLRGYTLKSLRAQISVVQQEAILFGLSVADNIRYGCPAVSPASASRGAPRPRAPRRRPPARRRRVSCSTPTTASAWAICSASWTSPPRTRRATPRRRCSSRPARMARPCSRSRRVSTI